MSVYSIESISKEAAKLNWRLLSKEYKNLKTPLVFICPQGHEVATTYGQWRNKAACPTCETEKVVIVGNPKKSGVRSMALDQSSIVTGFSIYDDKELFAYGKYTCTKEALTDKMQDISDWVAAMIKEHKIDIVSFEDVQYNPSFGTGHNVFKLLAQVMGSLMLTAAREGVEVKVLNISKWRQFCGIKGSERKEQKRNAQVLVKKWYDIEVSDDEAEAICQGRFLVGLTKRDKPEIGEWSM